MKRQHKQIPAIQALVEMLVGLRLDEGLGSAAAPEWALGTSVEEIFHALRTLGDGAWLDGVYEGYGVYDSADRWLTDFFEGREVPTPESAPLKTPDSGGA